MRLFLYGTLLDSPRLAACAGDPALPARLRPAALCGFQRVRLRRSGYPTLRRDPRGLVIGAVLDAPATAVARLRAYEGPEYRLAKVVVKTQHGRSRVAFAWIATGGTRCAWHA